MLRMEEHISALADTSKIRFFDRRYELLDWIISNGVAKIESLQLDADYKARKEAIVTLETIDLALKESGVLICIPTVTMSEGLTTKRLSEFNCKKYRYARNGQLRSFYGVDCDIGAFLYLSIGEVLQLPLSMMELPNHNFIRWQLNQIQHINWDNNSALIFNDDELQLGLSSTDGVTLTTRAERSSRFPLKMDEQEVVGYYCTIIADMLRKQGRYREAIVHYEKAIEIRPNSTFAMNNLSWMYLTVAELECEENHHKALQLSERVDRISPSNKTNKDTYSCACAAVGDFEKAIKVEKLAFNKDYKIEGFKKGLTCLELGEE